MKKEKIMEFVKQLTLEEKASLTSGQNAWFTKAIDRLSIPSVHVSDGPHGLRTIDGDQSKLDNTEVIKAVSFPAEVLTASSFDRDLMEEVGSELGRQARSADVHVLLGPGINIKRTPLCGRNFEYMSEDPYAAGELGAAYVKGVQSQGVGTSLKHYFGNNQEYRRHDISVEMDERTMHEIYLSAFEKVVKEAQPWTIMASYNRVDGVYSTANKKDNDILRKDFGFEGLIVSDWGATHDRVEAIRAGTDLTMPGEGGDEEIVEAVRNGRLAEEELDECCVRILDLVYKTVENFKPCEADLDSAHQTARKAAAESMVLLKNDDHLLPLNKNEKIAYIGLFAEKPRFQGGGSSNINAYKVVSPLEAAAGLSIRYAQGYDGHGETNEDLLKEAVEIAENAEKAVIFAGLHDDMESEGVDRVHMEMSEGHNRLIEEVCKVNPNTVVVLFNGSPITMPWIDLPKAILEAYLPGESVGEAITDVLFGDVCPSGHLSETFPLKLEDNPTYLNYPGEGNIAKYSEGVFVGYRYYETKKQEVLFPFGYGLSYADLTYSNLRVSADRISLKDHLEVLVDVTNHSDFDAKALVQLYVAPSKLEMIRPVRELKGFVKGIVKAHETETFSLILDERSFAHYNVIYHDFKCESGRYTIQIGENAHDIVLSKEITLDCEPLVPIGGYSDQSPMYLLAATKQGKVFLDENIIYMIKGMIAMGYIPEQILQVIESIPGGLTLDALKMIGERMGNKAGAGGKNGLDALLAQSINILKGFLPAEKKNELDRLIIDLNSTYQVSV